MRMTWSKYPAAGSRFSGTPKKGLISGGGERRGVLNAVFGRGSGGCEVVRLLANGILLSVGLAIGSAHCAAADLWGGSVGITSDYLVRGVSRSNDRAALQLDVHYLDSSGFVAGLFASNTQIDRHLPENVELDVFLGFVWRGTDDWQGRALVSHYAYPWNLAGSSYDYTELDLDVSYRGWLNLALVYSPDAPLEAYHRYIGVSSEAAEASLQRRLVGKLSATAGVGYAYYGGPDPAGYVYWSVGTAYDLAPVSLALSYVNTSASAKALFYNAAADNRWTGTVIWRF
jgi:uncharacterized protein (TIGR02001 family)